MRWHNLFLPFLKPLGQDGGLGGADKMMLGARGAALAAARTPLQLASSPSPIVNLKTVLTATMKIIAGMNSSRAFMSGLYFKNINYLRFFSYSSR